jgi:hypothetical protein
MEYCIRQYRTFNDADLYILTDRVNIPHLRGYTQGYERIFLVAMEDYTSDKILRFNASYNHGAGEFWNVAAARLIYIENFLRENDLTHIYHFENDVLVYFNIKEYDHIFRQLYPGLAFTPCSSTQSSTGFLYIDDYEALEHMTDFFIEMLENLGIAGIEERYQSGMVHESSLMRLYDRVTGCAGNLPILPFGEHSENLDCFGGIFDPVSYGQFLGGTRVEGPGARYPVHYVGAFLLAHPQCTIGWGIENGLWLPYLNCDDNLVKLNTLHVHSKNLHLFASEREKK